MIVRTAVLAVLALSVGFTAAQQPNPPKWPSNVVVFDQSTPASTIEAAVNAAFSVNGGHDPPNNGQFSAQRFAFLFGPGTYNVEVPVGFYTDVRGLGESPDDVTFTSPKGVYCEEGDYVFNGGALVTFWRGAENFKTQANFKWATVTGMLWAVSQASILNRVHVTGGLSLYEYQPPYQAAGYASGGYMSNSQIDGVTTSGSQQQWYTRNTQLSGWNGGVWNMVYSGCPGAPASHCSNGDGGLPYTTADSTPVIAEKPYISMDAATGKFSLNIPSLRTNAVGTDWAPGKQVDFSNVYVANNETDTADTINAAIAKGLHVVLTGGLYSLTDSININTADTVVMGLGWPTLIPTGGKPAIVVGNVDGVKLAGPILLQASATRTPALLQVGDGSYAGSASNPTFIYAVFGRVGGPDAFEVFADSQFVIQSGNVVIDGTWLWRADHTVSGIVKNSANPNYHGLVVTGDHVTAYGLAVEHTLQDLVQWAGNDGVVHFLQQELPYDVTQAQFGDPGFTGFRVNSSVTSFSGLGLGVYSFFRDYNVTVESGIVAPAAVVPSILNPLTVFLNGKGTINHVVNELGPATGWQGGSGGKPGWYCP